MRLIKSGFHHRLAWQTAVLVIFMTAAVACKQSAKPGSDNDMVGTYTLSGGPLEQFNYVNRVSAITLMPDHTFTVTNFPVPDGALISTNGVWSVGNQTDRTEWGMDQYTAHKLLLRFPELDTVTGHISRWGVELQFLVRTSRGHGTIQYQRTNGSAANGTRTH